MCGYMYDGLAHAWRAWAAAGGHKAMGRERGRRRDVDETHRAARLNDWMEGRGVRVPPALAALANARRLLRQRPVARRRMLANAEIGCGLAPDGRGRWAVESVLEWRGGFGGREALARWCGFVRSGDGRAVGGFVGAQGGAYRGSQSGRDYPKTTDACAGSGGGAGIAGGLGRETFSDQEVAATSGGGSRGGVQVSCIE